MKRIFLFIATNIAVLVVIRVILAILGINSTDQVGSLLAYSAVVGFSGSIVSLLMSKTIAKHSVGAVVIDQPQSEEEAWLLATVEAQARQWNLKTPEVAIYDSPEPNAFATGATKNSSLVAVSTGLLDHMTRDEVEAVLAHEMAHVGNGDMVTLTLIQGLKGNPSDLPQTMTAMGIASEAKDSWFSTHPSLDNRISRLKNR